MGKVTRVLEAGRADFPVLVDIWHKVFGDPEEELYLFLKFFYSPGSAILLTADGKPAAAAHLIMGSSLVGLGKDLKCAYLYAVGVLPEFRGLGYGACISGYAAGHCRDLGADICVTAPADSGLFPFYEKHGGFSAGFYCTTLDLRPELKTGGYSLKPLGPGEYSHKRGQILAGKPHLAYAPRWAEYYASACGKLFEIMDLSTGETALAAVELGPSRVWLKELLSLGAVDGFIGAAASYFKRGRATARIPGGGAAFAMSSPGLPQPAYFGLAFD